MKELSKVKIPNRVFTFSTKIWLPKNWIVYRQTNQAAVVPTLIAESNAIRPSSTNKEVKHHTSLIVNICLSYLHSHFGGGHV